MYVYESLKQKCDSIIVFSETGNINLLKFYQVKKIEPEINIIILSSLMNSTEMQ